MKRTRPRKAEPFLWNIASFRKNASLFLTLLIFFLGMIYGVLLCRGGEDVYDSLQFLVGEYSRGMPQQSILQTFLYSFGSVFFFLLVAYLLGFCSIGLPLILLIPLFQGLGLGSFMGYLYFTQGLHGIGYCLLILLPYTMLALIAIVIGCREAIRLAGTLFHSILVGNGPPINPGALKLYHMKFLILCTFALGAALIHTICLVLFARLFHF